VCGDFNASSPEDAIDRRQLIAAFRSFASEPEQAVDRFIESGRQVFARLAEFGLRDAISGFPDGASRSRRISPITARARASASTTSLPMG